MIEQLSTPAGTILFATHNGALAALGFDNQWPALAAHVVRRFGPMEIAHARSDVSARLERYFAGDLTAVDALRTDVEGTPFQLRVWDLLRTIPAGETCAYSDLATRMENPTASRAVGAANGRNPVSIVVPCHRVIGKSLALTGYAGGIERKRWLLAHEIRHTTNVARVSRGAQLALG